MSIIPEPYYYQGIDKEWTRQSRVDYYWPSFAHLGEQEIDKSELSVGTSDGETDTYGKLFGYAPRYAEYKFSKNIITGSSPHDSGGSIPCRYPDNSTVPE